MFQSKTGWAGVAASVVGILTATDVVPIVSEFLTASIGAKAAHLVGLFLSLAGLVVAKLSDNKPATPPTP